MCEKKAVAFITEEELRKIGEELKETHYGNIVSSQLEFQAWINEEIYIKRNRR